MPPPELGDLKARRPSSSGQGRRRRRKVVKTFVGEFQKPSSSSASSTALSFPASRSRPSLSSRPRDSPRPVARVLQAPAVRLVRTLNEPASSLARILMARPKRPTHLPRPRRPPDRNLFPARPEPSFRAPLAARENQNKNQTNGSSSEGGCPSQCAGAPVRDDTVPRIWQIPTR